MDNESKKIKQDAETLKSIVGVIDWILPHISYYVAVELDRSLKSPV